MQMVDARATARRNFLTGGAYEGANIVPVAGDASARRYFRLTMTEGSAILMDAPDGADAGNAPFVAIAAHLRGLGLSAPEILDQDAEQGFLLLEDLGDDLFTRIAARMPGQEETLYHAAADVLEVIAANPPPPDIPIYGVDEMASAIAPVTDWYARAGKSSGSSGMRDDLVAVMGEALTNHASGALALSLRDYHADNLIWLPGRQGAARVGILDFQDAVLTHPAYDLVSLVMDARRDVPVAIRDALIGRAADRSTDPEAWRIAAALISAQRNLRILGIFARLSLRDGKSSYLRFVPRVWAFVEDALAHPALGGMRQAAASLPLPDTEHLARLAGGNADA